MTLSVVVTEDTPADMLTGQMGIKVLLPSGKKVKMNVNRSTPMMDLLVQVTTSNRLSPAAHLLQPYGESGLLPYKPSTPIGALDTWTVHVVPKLPSGPNTSSSKSGSRLSAQPFEQTFRLQVHLPRNQLYVMRVSGKTVLGEILTQACEEKCLDPAKYSLRHPKQPDQVLDENLTFNDYRHNQICIVSKKAGPTPVSNEDIFGMYPSSYPSADSSSRSLSPDSSVSPQPSGVTRGGGGGGAPPPRARKRRPAPKPPAPQQQTTTNGSTHHQSKSEGLGSTTVICHSRSSSDSSGYHEASVLSESPDSNNSLADSLPRRSKLPGDNDNEPKLKNNKMNANSGSSLAQKQMLSRSMNCLNTKGLSTASQLPGRAKKKQAPAPPPSVGRSLSEDHSNPGRKDSGGNARTLPPGMSLRCPAPTRIAPSSPPRPVVSRGEADEPEPTMDDEEIDRIFKEATKGELAGDSDDSSPNEKQRMTTPSLPWAQTDNNETETRSQSERIAVDEEPDSIVMVAQEVTEVVENIKPEPKPDIRPQPRTDHKPEPKTEQKPEVRAQHRPEVKPQPRPDQKPKIVDVLRQQRSFDELDRIARVDDVQKNDYRRSVLVLMSDEHQKVADVMNELSSVISDRKTGAKRSDSLKRTELINQPPLESSSSLENFKITTYERRPQQQQQVREEKTTEEVEDQSAKKSPVKRSVSLFYKPTGLSQVSTSSQVDDDVGRPSAVSEVTLRHVLRKTTSEINIKPDQDEKSENRQDAENTITGLQSLQVLRSILPQLSQSQGSVDKLVTANNTNSNNKTVIKKPPEVSPKPVQAPNSWAKPKVTMTTWGEREKRQVSIKWDSDYHGPASGQKQETDTAQQQKQEQEPQEQKKNEVDDQQPPTSVVRVRPEQDKPRVNGHHKTTVVIVKDETPRGGINNRNGHAVYRSMETGNTRPLPMGRQPPTVVAMQPRAPTAPLVSRIHFRGDTVLGTDSGGVKIIGSKFSRLDSQNGPANPVPRTPTSSNPSPSGPSQDLLAQIRTFGGRSNLKKPLAT